VHDESHSPADEIIDAEFEEAVTEEVRGQKPEVSEESGAASPHLTSDLRPLTSSSFAPAGQRDMDACHEAVHGEVRQRLLLSLATAGPAPVSTLAERTGIERPTVSHHLGLLKLGRIVHNRRRGKHVQYECAPGCVRVHREGPHLFLTVTQTPGGPGVTIFAPADDPPAAAPAANAPADA
jgi:DNA-binding transcriptional ArsR family regulator